MPELLCSRLRFTVAAKMHAHAPNMEKVVGAQGLSVKCAGVCRRVKSMPVHALPGPQGSYLPHSEAAGLRVPGAHSCVAGYPSSIPQTSPAMCDAALDPACHLHLPQAAAVPAAALPPAGAAQGPHIWSSHCQPLPSGAHSAAGGSGSLSLPPELPRTQSSLLSAPAWSATLIHFCSPRSCTF